MTTRGIGIVTIVDSFNFIYPHIYLSPTFLRSRCQIWKMSSQSANKECLLCTWHCQNRGACQYLLVFSRGRRSCPVSILTTEIGVRVSCFLICSLKCCGICRCRQTNTRIQTADWAPAFISLTTVNNLNIRTSFYLYNILFLVSFSGLFVRLLSRLPPQKYQKVEPPKNPPHKLAQRFGKNCKKIK